ncbi:MAG TPA: beta-propeller domain-containing protein [Oligoflexus sp.]|uniref:beta-propeller domain-containing protein n=1 Tax=Oligoflexus sp. TaxID=1971216 RepID=UPI002D3D2C6A|nr:beta-propeller domain-containing protein [Oligoflexus sp.]HYX38219.1 beta-propeller domain-containing protein [Oligoflexus sp.]
MHLTHFFIRFSLATLLCAPVLLHGNTSAAPSSQEALEQALQRKPAEYSGMSFYSSCAALRDDLKTSFDEMWLQEKAWISAAIGMDRPIYGVGKELEEASPAASDEGGTDAGVDGATNVQERGVDEADRFRVGDGQIFALSSDEYVQILDRVTQERMGRLYLPGLSQTQLLTAKDRLVVLGQMAAKPGQDMTVVRIYATAPRSLPVLLREQRFLGGFFTTRLIGDQLLLVVRDAIPELRVPVPFSEFQSESWFPNAEKRRKLYEMRDRLQRRILPPIRNGQLQGIACQRYVQRPVRDWDLQLTKTYLINIRQQQAIPGGVPDSIGMVGSTDELYVTSRNLYILKQQIQWFSPVWWGKPVNIVMPEPQDERLRMQQISLQNGFLQPAAAGQVRGRIKDRWSLREIKDGRYLAVATTTGFLGGFGGEPALNHLFIVAADGQGRLATRASVENFAPKEDIRSVRYIGDYAYIVTFEKTDPLFAFDLSDPEHPRLLSELKVPGFSTYMHPLGDGRLIGVGFDTVDQGDFALFQGVKISLFGIADPTEINELQAPLIYGIRGSSSEVATDPKAFFYDSKAGLIGIPVIALRPSGEWGTQRDFSGALLLQLKGNHMVESARISHVEWVDAECRAELDVWRWWQDSRPSMDINRIYRLGDQLVTLSRWGLKSYRTGQWDEPTVRVSFPDEETSCATNGYYY